MSEHLSATISHAFNLLNFHPHVSLPPFINSQLSLITSSSTTSARYLPTNHTLFRLHSPRLSFFLFTYSLSFCTSGNDNQYLAIVAQH